MTDDAEPLNVDELVEQQLRFLSDGGPQPAPDLSGDELDDAQILLKVVDALVDSSPPSPPLVRDPVAIRLGLVAAPSGPPIVGGSADPVTASVQELQRRFGIDVLPSATDGTSFKRRLECRSMVENILVIVAPPGASRKAIAVHARGAFALADELSAVVYTDESASEATVMTYTDCHQRLEPGSGWRVEANEFESESLILALSRYLERSDPRWEDVRTLDASQTLSGMELDAAGVVRRALETLAASKPRLEHKKLARDRVGEVDDGVFIDWARDVQNGNLDAEALGELIRAHVGQQS